MYKKIISIIQLTFFSNCLYKSNLFQYQGKYYVFYKYFINLSPGMTPPPPPPPPLAIIAEEQQSVEHFSCRKYFLGKNFVDKNCRP